MTLIYEHNLKILKIYLHIKTELPRSRLSIVRADRQTERQRDRCNQKYYHSRIRISQLVTKTQPSIIDICSMTNVNGSFVAHSYM